jgi:hypothetical protein
MVLVALGAAHTEQGVIATMKRDLMLKSTFWTHRRFTGITLILGCFLFPRGLGLLPRDSMGNFVVNLPLQEQLFVIAARMSFFQWSFSLIISGLIVALLGFAMLTTLLRDAGDVTFSYLALITLPFGDILLAIFIAFHLGIASVGVQETVRTRVVPDYYVQLILWTQPLFVIYTILAFLALAAYGETFLPTRVLPHWMGRLSIVYGLAGLVFAGFAAGNTPSFLHYLMPIVMGILLLLQRPQRRIGRHHEEASPVAELSAVIRRETMSMKSTSPLEQ